METRGSRPYPGRSGQATARRFTEVSSAFACFGARCSVFVIGDTPGRSARAAVALARSFLLDWHDRFTRFEPDS